MTLQKDLFPFDLPTDACHSQPHKTRIYEQVHPSAAFPTASNHGTLSLKQWSKSFQKGSLLCFCTKTKPRIKMVELMKATVFNIPTSCGYREEEFITQAYLYLLPE